MTARDEDDRIVSKAPEGVKGCWLFFSRPMKPGPLSYMLWLYRSNLRFKQWQQQQYTKSRLSSPPRVVSTGMLLWDFLPSWSLTLYNDASTTTHSFWKRDKTSKQRVFFTAENTVAIKKSSYLTTSSQLKKFTPHYYSHFSKGNYIKKDLLAPPELLPTLWTNTLTYICDGKNNNGRKGQVKE